MSRKGHFLLAILSALQPRESVPPFKGSQLITLDLTKFREIYSEVVKEGLEKKLLFFDKLLTSTRRDLKKEIEKVGVLVSDKLAKTFQEINSPHPVV